METVAQFEQDGRVRLSEDDGLATGRCSQARADRAAVDKDSGVIGGTDEVRVRCKPGQAGTDPVSSAAQPFIGQSRVEADYDCIRCFPICTKSSGGKLLLERWSAQDRQGLCPWQVVPQMGYRR